MKKQKQLEINYKELFATIADILQPPKFINAVTLAEKHLLSSIQDDPLSFDLTPYNREIVNNCLNPNAIIINIAPARAGKTATALAIALNFIEYVKGDIYHFFSVESDVYRHNADDFRKSFARYNKEKIIKSNTSHKLYKTGSNYFIRNITGGNLRGYNADCIILSEIDAYKELHEGELLTLAKQRLIHTDGTIVIESTPKYLATEQARSPHALHYSNNSNSIVNYYNDGSKARYYWNCIKCNEPITPNYKNIVKRKDEYFCKCYKCSFLIAEKYKLELTASGYWIHEDKEKQKDHHYSYYLSPVYAFGRDWKDLYSGYQNALTHFKNKQDTSKLQTFLNTACGLPYLEKKRENDFKVKVKSAKKLVPNGASFIIASIDSQGGQGRRLEVGIFAYLQDNSICIIDRFALDIDGTTEDQEEYENKINDIFDMQYQSSENSNLYFKITALAIDSQGEAKYAETIKCCWWSSDYQSRFYLYKGASHKQDTLIKEANTNDYDLYLIDTAKFKDMIFFRLDLNNNEPRSIYFYNDFEELYLNEITAEIKINGKWVKEVKSSNNETLDLFVYALALLEQIEAEDMQEEYLKHFSKKIIQI